MLISDLVAVQVALLLALLFEPPRLMLDGQVKTISDGLREHPGIGLGIFVSTIGILHPVIHRAYFFLLAQVLAWFALAGYIGILLYPTTEPNAHALYATVAMASPLLLQTQLLLEGYHTLLVYSAIAWLLLLALGTSFLFWPVATGIFQILYVSMLWLSWAAFSLHEGC